MTTALVVTTLWLIFNDFYFLAKPGENNGALDLSSLDERSPDGRVRSVVDEEYFVEDN